MLFADLGLALVLLVLALFLLWRLFDLFQGRGRWSQELAESGVEEVLPEVYSRPLSVSRDDRRRLER